MWEFKMEKGNDNVKMWAADLNDVFIYPKKGAG